MPSFCFSFDFGSNLIFDFCGRFTFMGISAVSGDIALISGRLFFAARTNSNLNLNYVFALLTKSTCQLDYQAALRIILVHFIECVYD